MPEPISRRDFIKTATTAGAAVVALGATAQGAEKNAPAPAAPPRRKGAGVAGLVTPKLETVRWGLIGVGARGGQTLRELLMLEHCEVRGLCDDYEPNLRRGLDILAAAGRPAPAAFGGGPEDYKRMLERSDIDAVLICTPWRWHVPMAVDALRAGKHAFVEVPAAVTLEECWQLVETAEETQLHCMMLENCCYGREELMLLNLCRQGLLGELLHGHGAYLHDLREQMRQVEHGTGSWRTREHELRNGNLYPTHGLGPIAQYMSINRGDRFDYLVSLSSPARGLRDFAERNFPAGHPRRTARYGCGDMNTSIIKTTRGRTIMVQHDTSNPRPYSRVNMIEGTHGLFAGYPDRIYVEGRGKADEWDTDLQKWYDEFEHPLWKKVEAISRKMGYTGGHGGMDFVMRWRIVQCLREGLPLDQDVYDAATWSSIGPLSERAVAQRGGPVDVPDFTRGAWETMAPLGIVS